MPPIYLGEAPNRRQLWRGVLVGLVLVILGFCTTSVLLYRTISDYGQRDHTQPADVIIVLGAGSRRVVERRAAHGGILWQEGVAEHIICTGGEGRYRRAEAEYCLRTLREMGIPEAVIHLERNSRSTEQNAIEAQAIMTANGWQSAVLVSDNYHLWRANLIFESHFQSQGWQVATSPAQLTQRDVPARFYDNAVTREVMATYWHVGKELLGLPYTDFPPS